MSTGIIVGRFQTPYLHEGHRLLIEQALEECGSVVCLIGRSPLQSTKRNPLSYFQRVKMIQATYPDVICRCILDRPRDEDWSDTLDNLCETYAPDIKLYVGRDSFAPYYTGKYGDKIVTVDSGVECSSTELRKRVSKDCSGRNNTDFRAGVITGASRRWINAVPCVDVAIISVNENILLGKKSHDGDAWRLIGGFVDSNETFESAATREVKEETGLNIQDPLEYMGSFVVDDWRYRNEEAKITTMLFVAFMSEYKEAVASDDIDEVKWFPLDNLPKIIEGHKDLVEEIRYAFV